MTPEADPTHAVTLPELKLSFSGRILEHLGLQMYQSPVASIAELVANAWDADASHVRITIPAGKDGDITIDDDGHGMSYEDCRTHYLEVGRDRRAGAVIASTGKERPVLGRKGIGKFAGFGIAAKVRVDTTSAATGERTVFEMDYDRLRGQADYVREGGEIDLVRFDPPDPARIDSQGTTITLSSLRIGRIIPLDQFKRAMARRFVLLHWAAGFEVTVNGQPLPEWIEEAKLEYAFPRDYRADGRPEGLTVHPDGWGEEEIRVDGDARKVYWRIFFYKEPIDDEEFQGVSVFANGKLVQTPFFFRLSGGLGGQHGQSYLCGQVRADYVDALEQDLIAPERQRINWQAEELRPLQEWGQSRLKELLRLWRDRRGEERVRQIQDRIAPFLARLRRYQPHEYSVVEKALNRVARVPALSDTQFRELAIGLLEAWENGRLHDLIRDLARTQESDDQRLIAILTEAEVLTSLQAGEAVKAKVKVVEGLRERLERRELELAVRDYIAEHPWLISPEWETYRVETRASNIFEEARSEAGITDAPDWRGRVDLVLSAGQDLLVVEFMRPGLRVDRDHIDRFERYVDNARAKLGANTALPFRRVSGFLVADRLSDVAALQEKLRRLARAGMTAIEWKTLLDDARARWRDFLFVLQDRTGHDPRLEELVRETVEQTGATAPDNPEEAEGKADAGMDNGE